MNTNPVNFSDLVPKLSKDQIKAIDAIDNINLIYDSPIDDERRKHMITDVVIDKAFERITDMDSRVMYLAGILDHFLAKGMNEIASLDYNLDSISEEMKGEFDVNKITDLPEVVILLSNYINDKKDMYGPSLPEKVANQVKVFQAECLAKHVAAVSSDDTDAEYIMYMTIASHTFENYLKNSPDDNITLDTITSVCIGAIKDEYNDRISAGIKCNEKSYRDAMAHTIQNLTEVWNEAINAGYAVPPSNTKKPNQRIKKSMEYTGPNGVTTYEKYMQTDDYIKPLDTMNLSKKYSNNDIGKIISDARFNDIVNANAAKCIRQYEERKNSMYSNILSHVFIIDKDDKVKYGELIKQFIGSPHCQEIIASYGGGSAIAGSNSFQFMVTGLTFTAPTNFGLDVSGIVLIMGTTISCGISSSIANDLIRAAYNYMMKNR